MFEDSRQELHTVALLASRGEGALAGAATVELGLDEVEIKGNAGRTAVDDASDGGAVALAEGGQAKKGAKCIHGRMKNEE